MQALINTHPYLAAVLGFAVAHFGHLTWAQVKEFGAFWESMRGWQGLIRFWKTGNPNPPMPPLCQSTPLFIPQFMIPGQQASNTPPQAEAAKQPETK